MRPVRIHILPVGFTPEVFTDPTGPLVKLGADKIITLHSEMHGSNGDIREKVEKTLKGLKEKFIGVHFEEIELENKQFMEIVEDCKKLLNRFGESDEIFIHLGGGERHLGLALVYGSFFSDKKIMIIPVLEYGIGRDRIFKYEEIPPMKPVEISDASKKILNLVLEREGGQTLTEIARRISIAGETTSIAPAVFRQLKKLQEYNLVDFDPDEKRYYPTPLSPLFIA